MANVPRFLYFLVWCGAVWGDRFIITPSEFFKEKGTFYSALVIPSSTLCFQKNLEIASCWSTFCTTQSISQTESYPTLIQSAIDQIANFFLHSTEEIKIRGHQKKKIEIRATEKYILSLPRWSLISSCPSYVRFYHCSELDSYLLTWCMHFHKY